MFSPSSKTESKTSDATDATPATPAPSASDTPSPSEDTDENDAPAAPAPARTALTRIPLSARPSNLPPLDVEAERLIARVLARLDETLEPHVRAIIVDAVEAQFAEAGEKVFFDQMRWFVDQDLPSLLSAEIDAVLEDRKNRGLDG